MMDFLKIEMTEDQYIIRLVPENERARHWIETHLGNDELDLTHRRADEHLISILFDLLDYVHEGDTA